MIIYQATTVNSPFHPYTHDHNEAKGFDQSSGYTLNSVPEDLFEDTRRHAATRVFGLIGLHYGPLRWHLSLLESCGICPCSTQLNKGFNENN